MSNSLQPMDLARQALLSVGFSRQEYWSGLSFPSPGYLPDLGIELMSPAWQVDSLPLYHLESPLEMKFLAFYSDFDTEIKLLKGVITF